MSPWFLVLGVRFHFEINKFGGGWVGLGEKVLVLRCCVLSGLIYTPTTARSTNRRVLVPSPEGTSVVLCGDDSPRIKSDQSIKQSTIQSILLVFFALK